MMDLSFQLYTARKFPLSEVMRMLADLGYKFVEGYGDLYSDPEGLQEQLRATGLRMPTAHVGLDMLEQPDRALRLADIFGWQVIVCPWLPPHQRPGDTAGWYRLRERLSDIARPYVEAGLTFGYHNHDFEFVPLEDDGRRPMEIILEAAPEIRSELDIAWMVRGNADPFPWLERHGPKLVAVHVKDIASAGENLDEDGWADIGYGTLPWKDLLSTVKERTASQYFVAEHDNPSDIERFARRSIEAIRQFGVL